MDGVLPIIGQKHPFSHGRQVEPRHDRIAAEGFVLVTGWLIRETGAANG